MFAAAYQPVDTRQFRMLRLLLVASLAGSLAAIELTFELPDNANQCFYEDIKSGIDSILEFQVNLCRELTMLSARHRTDCAAE